MAKKYKARFRLGKYLNAAKMGTLLQRADLVVSRAGANIVSELAALGKPALLIPLPFAHRKEQEKNAQLLYSVGIARILSQKELSSQKLIEEIDLMIRRKDFFVQKAELAKKLVPENAAEKIIQVIEEISK